MRSSVLILLIFLINILRFNMGFAETNLIYQANDIDNQSSKLAGIGSDDVHHNKFMNGLWNDYYQKNLAKLIEWQKYNIENIYDNDCHVFYPFSGPDIVHILSFFPNCSKYTLVGLESVGYVDNKILDEVNLEYLRVGLYSLFKKSFFITREMWSDFKLNNKGVTLPLLVLAKRLDYEVVSINPISLSIDGKVTKSFKEGNSNGINLILKKDGKIKEIFYFKQSLKDYNRIIPYLNNNLPEITYLKAAQYTLFSPEFMPLRQAILSSSKFILQDDSGIPFKYFTDGRWSKILYGRYQGPYGEDFKGYLQKDLLKLYSEEKPSILPFNLGYGYRRTNSCLMAFVKKEY